MDISDIVKKDAFRVLDAQSILDREIENDVVEFEKEFEEYLKAVILELENTMISYLNSLTGIEPALKDFVNKAKEIIQGQLRKYKDEIVKIKPDIKNVYSDLIIKFKNEYKNLIGKAKFNKGLSLDEFKNKFQELFSKANGMIDKAKGFAEKANNWAQSIMDGLLSKGKSMIDGLIDKMQGKMQGIKGKAKGLIDNLISKLKGKLAALGGLVNKAKSFADNVKNKASALAKKLADKTEEKSREVFQRAKTS